MAGGCARRRPIVDGRDERRKRRPRAFVLGVELEDTAPYGHLGRTVGDDFSCLDGLVGAPGLHGVPRPRDLTPRFSGDRPDAVTGLHVDDDGVVARGVQGPVHEAQLVRTFHPRRTGRATCRSALFNHQHPGSRGNESDVGGRLLIHEARQDVVTREREPKRLSRLRPTDGRSP